jgi:hypothetical protein
MTDLLRRVARRTVDPQMGKRRLVVILYPGDTIGIREERRRKIFFAPIDRAYRQMVVWEVEAKRAQKLKGKRRLVKRGLIRR